MERLVRHLTQQITQKLPEEQDYFTPEDLRSLGIFEFIVLRVEVEMNRNLSESIVPPESDWADMKTDQVRESWEQFIDAITEEVRMPASFAQTVLETTISDILDLITRPRMTIPEILFGEDDVLEFQKLKKRSEMITVNTHLVATLLRYMEKKGKEKLGRAECEAVIERIDQRLVSNYNALNWTQLLDPLFQLNGPAVDTNLFRVFFEEKGMLRVARKFDMMNSALTKTEFIEVLSAPYVLSVEEQEDSVSLFDVPPSKDPAQKPLPEDLEIPREEPEDTVLSDKTDEQEEAPADVSLKSESMSEEEDSIISNFHKRRGTFGGFESEDSEEEETEAAEEIRDEAEINEEEEVPLHKKFILDADEESDVEFDGDEIPKGVDESLLNEQDIPEDDEEEEDFTLIIDEDTETDSPMWKAFLENEEADDETESNNTFEVDEEIIAASVSAQEPDIQEEQSPQTKLSQWLADEKDEFTKGIFGGSESGFEQALEDLSGLDDWKSASRYIEKEIFSRNLIDMYDEIAVDFTDRLHTYFIEFKQSKIDE